MAKSYGFWVDFDFSQTALSRFYVSFKLLRRHQSIAVIYSNAYMYVQGLFGGYSS